VETGNSRTARTGSAPNRSRASPLMLCITTLLIVRNQRILAAWNARQEENQCRAAKGLTPKTRRRRHRKTLTALAATAMPP
jgi:hypothetical protein